MKITEILLRHMKAFQKRGDERYFVLPNISQCKAYIQIPLLFLQILILIYVTTLKLVL